MFWKQAAASECRDNEPYHPISGDDDDQFIELYNRALPVNLRDGS
jgi:hypothetical protein